jgi:hypothetical protein
MALFAYKAHVPLHVCRYNLAHLCILAVGMCGLRDVDVGIVVSSNGRQMSIMASFDQIRTFEPQTVLLRPQMLL